MRFGVLGPLMVWTADGEPVRIPEAKVRGLLARLLVHPGQPVSAGRLVDDLWSGGQLPANPGNALQGKVSQLRRVLGAAEPGGRGLVVSHSRGYLLRTDDGGAEVDATCFASLVSPGRTAAGLPERAAALASALGLWRGPAFAGYADEPFARAAAGRLEEDRLTALEEYAEVRLASGGHRSLTGELGDLVARHPLRERLRAAQLLALYRSGGQSAALDSYRDLRDRLAAELGLDPSRELTELHQAILRQDPALDAGPGPSPAPGHRPSAAAAPPPPVGTAPAPDPSPRPRTNLPAQVGGLVGRSEAVGQVRTLLERGRLVTLTGPGGVGKTRLAVEVAGQVLAGFPDGVRLVELAGLERTEVSDDVCTLAETLTGALGLDLRDDTAGGPATPGASDRASLVDRLAAALRDRRMLLVLDNCEHLVEAVAAWVEPLLRTAPRMRVLATGREPIGLSGELIWSVPPLELPPPSETEPGALLASSAVRLFLERASTAPGFALTGENAAAVATLCRRLDGLPLALELAASKVRTLGVHGLVTRLDDRFGLLAGGYRGAPARQRTLRAMIDWSWELLGPAEQVVLRRLAVHAEGCTLEAAEAVSGGDGIPPAQVLELLGRLVDRSLVVLADLSDGPRYRLLESVREYGSDRLRAAGELDAVLRRHADHYTTWAEHTARLLRGPEQRRWLERLDAESANLRRALDHAVRSGLAGHALRMADALAWYWVLRCRFAEAQRSLTAVLDAAGAVSAVEKAGPTAPARLRVVARVTAAEGTASLSPLMARAQAWRTGITLLQGDTAHGPARIADALDAYETVEDPEGLAMALWFLGWAQLGVGDVTAGEDLANRAVSRFRALDDPWGTAAALSLRARHALAHGDLAALRADGELSAGLFARLGDGWGRLQSVFPLASLAEITGDHAAAARLNQEGLELAEELGMWTEAVKRLTGLGRIALLTGDLADARDHHRRAHDLASEQGYGPGRMSAEIGLALGARREGDLGTAEELMSRLLDWYRSVDYGPGTTLALAELGFVAELRGEARTAGARHREGFEVARKLGDPRAMALALEGLAGALALVGQPRDAAILLGTAAAARRRVAAPLPHAERGDVDRITAAARAPLGPEAFRAAYEVGAALGPEEAYLRTDPSTLTATGP
ncbi:BTAD domain-containing putative transcriptional regulator [Streptomyces atroolivaceus]|uniref:AfsR/SARP family transcriptional regulator n=1 Tax=Streptomyces atroolivaceus TaxID=66869 RepID=UPI0036545FE2